MSEAAQIQIWDAPDGWCYSIYRICPHNDTRVHVAARGKESAQDHDIRPLWLYLTSPKLCADAECRAKIRESITFYVGGINDGTAASFG